ncbi:hypothetical protein [Mycolicibacterium sp. HS_4_1]
MGRPAAEIRGKFRRSDEFTVIGLVVAEAAGYGRRYVGTGRQPRREGTGKTAAGNTFQYKGARQPQTDGIAVDAARQGHVIDTGYLSITGCVTGVGHDADDNPVDPAHTDSADRHRPHIDHPDNAPADDFADTDSEHNSDHGGGDRCADVRAVDHHVFLRSGCRRCHRRLARGRLTRESFRR